MLHAPPVRGHAVLLRHFCRHASLLAAITPLLMLRLLHIISMMRFRIHAMIPRCLPLRCCCDTPCCCHFRRIRHHFERQPYGMLCWLLDATAIVMMLMFPARSLLRAMRRIFCCCRRRRRLLYYPPYASALILMPYVTLRLCSECCQKRRRQRHIMLSAVTIHHERDMIFRRYSPRDLLRYTCC